MTVVAGCLSLVLGIGFGVPCLIGIRHFAQTGEVWTFVGFPTYGGGVFQSAGISTGVPLLVAFLAVCVAEVVTGILLIRGVRGSRAMSHALLPLEFVFWIGFSLPVGPILGIARTVLLVRASRNRVRRATDGR